MKKYKSKKGIIILTAALIALQNGVFLQACTTPAGNERESLSDSEMKESGSIAPDAEGGDTNSTITVQDQTGLVVSEQKLTLADGEAVLDEVPLAEELELVDKNATEAAIKTYIYLQAVGKSKGVIYGHQNDTWFKAGSPADEKNGLTPSDTTDVTDTIPGVVGIDTLSLAGNEYNAERYNREIASIKGTGSIDIRLLGKPAADVKAAALLTNDAIENGAIISLSSHMPNFSLVKEREEYDGNREPSYGKYDFSEYTPNVLTGNTMNEILPGGAYNDKFRAFLDMIADYADQVEGTVLFRPFHENTGSWFWWGKSFCDESTYRNVFRYTVEYLRDEKGVHNFLYVYGPGSESETVEEYAGRYPGDEYVDIVGFDMYNTNPQKNNSQWLSSFKRALGIVNQFAEEHHKLSAVTETGVAAAVPAEGDNQTALYRTGNQDKQWYKEVLDIVSESDASYFLLWANFSQADGFYTPYVNRINGDGSLYGHEMLDSFIEFYNDSRTIFADSQKDALEAVPELTASGAAKGATGYITAPVSGKRVLEETVLTAKVTETDGQPEVRFILQGDQQDLILEAESTGGYYQAVLTGEDLDRLGETVGTTILSIDGKTSDEIRTIFNIPKPEEDPFEVDGFEQYLGDDGMLNSTWPVNKAAGNAIALSLNKGCSVYEGDFSMKFHYEESADGWAGAVKNKDADWSDCSALQFYTVPDGNNQKVVIQITANGTVYEAYLNEYENYRNCTDPLLVTIPFSEFVQRDTPGNPKGGLAKDCGNVTSFGVWVNAVNNSPAFENGMVTGTIYYDGIRAISGDINSVQLEKMD